MEDKTGDSARISRRRLVGTACVVFSSVVSESLLAACGSGAPAPTPVPTPTSFAPTTAPTATTAPATSSQVATSTPAPAGVVGSTAPVTLNIAGRNTRIDDIYVDVAKAYMAKHPNVTINYQRIPGQEYTQKQLLMAASKTSGDAYWACGACLFGQFALAGVFIDHTPLIRATNFDWNSLLPQAQRGATINGKIYGLPHACHAGSVALFINKNLFDKGGVPIPAAEWTNEPHPGYKNWTYDDFQKAAVALTQRQGSRTTQWGFLISHHLYDLVINLRSFGGDYLSPDGKKILFETPEDMAAIGFLADLYNKYKVSPTPAENPSGGPDLFASGKVAMTVAAVYNLLGARQTYKNFDWLTIPMPRGKGGVNGMFFFDDWSVLNTSKNPEITFDFLSQIASYETGLRQAKEGGVPGTAKAVWQDKDLLADPNFAIFAKLQQTTGDLVLPANYNSNELWQTSDKMLDPLFDGEETDTAKVVHAAAVKLQEILDRPPAGLSVPSAELAAGCGERTCLG
jgi:multiple sugar transport system substrate-binding protein